MDNENNSGNEAAVEEELENSAGLNELEMAVLALGTDGSGEWEESEEPVVPEGEWEEGTKENPEGEEKAEEPEEDPEEEDPEEAEEAEEAKKEAEAVSERVQKRFDKLTARAKTAEEQVEELRREIEEIKGQPADEPKADAPAAPRVAPALPYPDADTPEKVEAIEQHTRALRDWLIENPDGGEYRGAPGGEAWEIDEAQARKLLVRATRDLEGAIPEQKQALARQSQYAAEEQKLSSQAVEFFPELKDSSSEFRQRADRVVASLPAIKALPGWRMASAYYTLGHMLAEVAGPKALSVLNELQAKAKPGKAPAGSDKEKKETRTPPRAPRAPSVTGPRKVPADSSGKAAKNLTEAAVKGDFEGEIEAFQRMLGG